MATVTLDDELVENLLCPVCLDMCKEAVILECGHSFCKSCINRTWNNEDTPFCPMCRQEFSAKSYTVNRALCNMVQATTKAQPGKETEKSHHEEKSHCVAGSQECTEHKETLKGFCKEDGTPVCVVCMILSKHKWHTFLPLQEAVCIFKDKLKSDVAALESKTNHIKEYQNMQELQISGIQDEAQNLERHITSEFGKLHEFLQEKEQQLIRQLREEEGGIVAKMKEKLEILEATNKAIQKQISDIQSKLQQDDPLLFLTRIEDETESILKKHEEEDRSEVTLVLGSLSLGVYKGPLQYSVWKEMLSFINPGLSHLTLDPNTAHPFLRLSVDLTSVLNRGFWEQLPDNPERFECHHCVLASEGFTSGRHYWEVEVKNMPRCELGVTRKYSIRKGTFQRSPENGYWKISLWNDDDCLAWEPQCKTSSMSVKANKIGVYLDYEGGQVSFYNADKMLHLYTFSDTFTETLNPYFLPNWYYNSKKGETLKLFHMQI